jgi:hypothetical protein
VPNLAFVGKQQVPLLFEALTLGMMVHSPEDPVEVRVGCSCTQPTLSLILTIPLRGSFLARVVCARADSNLPRRLPLPLGGLQFMLECLLKVELEGLEK